MADAKQPKAVVAEQPKAVVAARGKFITLEGVDGAGKSTHVAWIAERLRAARHEVIVTRAGDVIPRVVGPTPEAVKKSAKECKF